MIHHPVKQGSTQWNELRRGRPTASCFERIVTPGGKLSAQAEQYMYQLAAERITGVCDNAVSTKAMDAGRVLEPEAADWYAFHCDVEPELVGICFTDDGRIGASPDRLIGSDGLLEIKCPQSAAIHIKYLMAGGIVQDYKPQVQGQLYVCEREWIDSTSYFVGLPKSLVRIYRDEEYINKLSAALREFCDRLDECEHKLRSMGAAA